jgi:uncharacterized SAM-binding protein YcdF (DUF218 family)
MARLLAALVLAVAAALAALTAAGRFLVVSDPLPVRADAIVVMAGGIEDRALEAADLYAAGHAPRVVITRERASHSAALLRARGVRLPESHDLLRWTLVGLGVPEAAIVDLRRRTRSTETEARTIARWACANRLRSLIVVTSRAHTRRTGLILRRALGPGIALSVQPSRYDVFPTARWWRVRDAAKAVLLEYEKLAHYWLRERWRIAPCGGLRRRSLSP